MEKIDMQSSGYRARSFSPMEERMVSVAVMDCIVETLRKNHNADALHRIFYGKATYGGMLEESQWEDLLDYCQSCGISFDENSVSVRRRSSYRNLLPTIGDKKACTDAAKSVTRLIWMQEWEKHPINELRDYLEFPMEKDPDEARKWIEEGEKWIGKAERTSEAMRKGDEASAHNSLLARLRAARNRKRSLVEAFDDLANGKSLPQTELDGIREALAKADKGS